MGRRETGQCAALEAAWRGVDKRGIHHLALQRGRKMDDDDPLEQGSAEDGGQTTWWQRILRFFGRRFAIKVISKMECSLQETTGTRKDLGLFGKTEITGCAVLMRMIQGCWASQHLEPL